MTEWTPVTGIRSQTTWDGGDTLWDPLEGLGAQAANIAGTVWDPVSDSTEWTRVN